MNSRQQQAHLKLRKRYVRPELIVTGDIASLTEASGGSQKGPGSGDAFLLSIDGPASGGIDNTSYS